MENKKKILIIGATRNGTDAVSGIMKGVSDYIANECEIYFFGFDFSGCFSDKIKDSHNLCIANPHSGIHPISLFYRTKKKIFTKLGIDTFLIASDYTYSKLLSITKNISFDLVIGVAGRFSFIETAYRFASYKNIPLKLIYFDPFINNISSKNVAQRREREKIWLSYADRVYYNLENSIPVYMQNRSCCKGFYIPLIFKSIDGWSMNNILIYGGTFYKNIREPKLLYDFGNLMQHSGFEIECYSTLKNYPQDSFIHFFPVLNRKTFEKKCLEAKALIYIGNSGGNSKSSKYLEYISWKKPIVGINVETDNEVRKYKYYFDEKDPDLILKLNKIVPTEIKEYNPLTVFKNRNPYKLAEEWFLVN